MTTRSEPSFRFAQHDGKQNFGENNLTDYHVHIGQWFNIYYSAESIFTALKAAGTDEIWFSSTTSERYCTESPAVIESISSGKKNANGKHADIQFPTAIELYEIVREEIKVALKTAEKINLNAHALYWVVPEIHKSSLANITIEKAMSELPYEGFKIHPRGNIWNLDDEKTVALANEVFTYAEKHNLMILIHCGPDEFELPNKFEQFIARYPKVLTQLAHTRPLDMTLEMLKKYPNTICDTAFTPKDVQEKVKKSGFAERIRHGTDFPIPHYYFCKPDHDPTTEELIEFLNNEK